MTRATYRFATALILAGGIVAAPVAARAALMADPTVLYAQMKDAFAKGNTDGWNFRSQSVYLSTIFNAGRAYSLQYPTDPNYAVLCSLTVAIGSGLHYNPLTNHDGAVWWVREAADWVSKHSARYGDDRAGSGAARARQLGDESRAARALRRRGRDGQRSCLSRRPRRADRAGRSELARLAADARSAVAVARAEPRGGSDAFPSRTCRRRGGTNSWRRHRARRRVATATHRKTSRTRRRF